ncbi:ethanolamine utilization protein EutA [Paenibacillus baekrokdamisoli]|nr:ethanolamine utilization protein EutA [Paenibacillus baekrokdamisoli]
MNRMEEQWITSVGIDIGTSTTKMIVSRLKLIRTSSAVSIPRYEIVERELVYASPIYSTPLLSDDEIDAERIWDILLREYELAAISPSSLKSGAVIITGETAIKRNARHILHLLAERSGDFVVATAGADLEGLLAGKGAGAENRSREARGAVANIDVGGGTANAAVFLRGRPVGTVTFHVGGRLIQVDSNGIIAAISPSIRPWLDACGFRIRVGQQVSFTLLKEICAEMCRDMLDFMTGFKHPRNDKALSELILGDYGLAVPPIEEWMISGGVGLLMEKAAPANMAEMAVHGDIGPLLAHSLKETLARYPIKLTQPDQTVRATVIGAGMQSTEISGATVHLDASELPIRNLPVYKLPITNATLEHAAVLVEALHEAMKTCAALYGQESSPPFALALTGSLQPTYKSVQELAVKLAESYRIYFPTSGVLVIICENDMALALGQSLQKQVGNSLKLICIDQIKVEHGDYIDLGEPISGTMIPVVIKTLAFNDKTGGAIQA